MSLAYNPNRVKNVQDEAIRLVTMILRLEMKKIITPERSKELQLRVTQHLGLYSWDLKVLADYEGVEAVITCPHCHGTGVRRIVNGFDAGEIFVATGDEYVPCHCDHDGEQDVEIGG